MTQHYNRPPLDPVDVYIQPVATTPGHHTITRSGGASLTPTARLPTLTLRLRCAPLANGQTHVAIWPDSTNPIYRGELGDA
jgi:hypothetical protein